LQLQRSVGPGITAVVHFPASLSPALDAGFTKV
jgi:hypothetical protein